VTSAHNRRNHFGVGRRSRFTRYSDRIAAKWPEERLLQEASRMCARRARPIRSSVEGSGIRRHDRTRHSVICSERSDLSRSRFAARHAGWYAATTAAAIRETHATAIVSGSCGLMPNSRTVARMGRRARAAQQPRRPRRRDATPAATPFVRPRFVRCPAPTGFRSLSSAAHGSCASSSPEHAHDVITAEPRSARQRNERPYYRNLVDRQGELARS